MKSTNKLKKSEDFLGFKSKILRIAKRKITNTVVIETVKWSKTIPLTEQFSYKLQFPQICINADLCKTIRSTTLDHQIYQQYRSKTNHNRSQRSRKTIDLSSLQAIHYSLNCNIRQSFCLWGSSGAMSRSSSGLESPRSSS